MLKFYIKLEKERTMGFIVHLLQWLSVDWFSIPSNFDWFFLLFQSKIQEN